MIISGAVKAIARELGMEKRQLRKELGMVSQVELLSQKWRILSLLTPEQKIV